MIRSGYNSRTSTTGSVIPMTFPVPVALQFNRFDYGPSFQLAALPSNSDSIPPQRVTDLSVVEYDSSSRTLVLGWTASKDNYGAGDYGSLIHKFLSLYLNLTIGVFYLNSDELQIGARYRFGSRC